MLHWFFFGDMNETSLPTRYTWNVHPKEQGKRITLIFKQLDVYYSKFLFLKSETHYENISIN